jgi:hypothetical protein
MFASTTRRGSGLRLLAVLAPAVLAGALAGVHQPAFAAAQLTSSMRGSDGKTYSVTNHLTRAAFRGGPREWLLAWAGAVDTTNSAPDFIAVIDATRSSRTYGQVVNTVTLHPQVQNEPHHMQYIWHKGQRVYAAGILSDTTLVLDASRLPQLRLVGINLPADTPCGTGPDAYWTLRDGTAYGTYVGGPNVSGPCRYSDGTWRTGNGAAGSPGEVVRLGPDGRTLAEIPAALPQGENPDLCHDIPAIQPATCANPHGIQVREDLNRMVVSDFAEVRNYLDPTTVQIDPFLLRSTERIYDIRDRDRPTLVSVSRMPDGPRADPLPAFDENRMVMEATVTNRPAHRGAFVSTMAGGAVFYTPDITDPDPQWREVFDDTTAYRAFDASGSLTGSNSGGSWLQVSPDDRFLFHGVMGSDPRLPRAVNSGMVYVLDIRKLLAAGGHARCRIDQLAEVTSGGAEPDCPALTGVVPIRDTVSPGVGVGPHWGAMDNFARGAGGFYGETRTIRRIATADYFLARSGIDGDHRVCVLNVSESGRLSLDASFRDEVTGAACVNFNRQNWPHGAMGGARPHGVLFVVSDKALR